MWQTGECMRLGKQAGLPDVPYAGLRPGVERLRPSRLTKPYTQAEIMAEVVPELTRRVVAAVRPARIILFGSAARGQMGAHSDLDVLVVVADGVDQNQASKDGYLSLRGLGFAVDLLVVGESDLAQYGDDRWMVYRSALADGKELYCAKTEAQA